MLGYISASLENNYAEKDLLANPPQPAALLAGIDTFCADHPHVRIEVAADEVITDNFGFVPPRFP